MVASISTLNKDVSLLAKAGDTLSTSMSGLGNVVKSQVAKEIQALNKYTLNLTSDIGGLTSSVKTTVSGLKEFNSSLKSSETLGKAFTGSLSGAGKAGVGLVTGLAGLAGVVVTLKSVVDLGLKGVQSFREFQGVSKTLTFSEAILGTTQLAENFKFLEQTSNVAIDGIRQGFAVIFNNEGFNQFSGKAVKAYADVEEAAYRLATIAVTGNERSINSIDKFVGSMRNLQRETNFALDSISLLNAQYDIASAGFTDSQANVNVGTASINLAQAGFGSLAGSTNAVVRVLRALGEDSDSANVRAAQLFETTKIGLLTLDQLTPVIGSLSSQGKQLGVDFEEIAGSLAVLTTQGVSVAEASTKLQSFLGDVVSVSPDAAAALAQFRDEAGKPIQLNATTLKEKGIQGIIKDLKTATNGELSKIQQVFANKESQEFASLLIGAGEESLSGSTDRIRNVNQDGFTEEAENRTKTLRGSFEAAFNQSQAGIEGFGQGIKDSVLTNLESTNTLLSSIANGGATQLGSLLGTLNVVQGQVSAVGGFIGTAFSTVAPIALFSVAIKGLGSLSAKFKSLQAEGESPFQSIKRVALETLEKIEDEIVKTIARASRKLEGLKQDIRAINDGVEGKTTPQKALPASSSVAIDLPEIDKFSKTVDSKVIPSTTKAKQGFFGLGKVGEVSSKAIGSVSGSFGFLGKAVGFVGTVLKSTAGLIAGLGIAAGVGFAALAIIGGQLDTLGKLANKSTIPELKKLKETVESLQGVSGLSESISDLDEFSGKIEESNVLVAVYAESLTRLGGIFNTLTGKTRQNKVIQQELNDAQNAIKADTSTSLSAGKAGLLDASNAKEEAVNSKIKLGVTLDVEDLKVVEDNLDNQIKANQTLITLQEQKISSEKANGGGDPARLEQLQSELSSIKNQVKAENELLELQKQKIKFGSSLKNFQNIDTSIPLNIQITNESITSVNNQVKSVVDNFNAIFKDGSLSPDELASRLTNVIPELNASFASLQTQITIDPESASIARKQLEEGLGDNFSRLLVTDPALRSAYQGLVSAETDARVENRATREVADSSVLNSASSLGLDGISVTSAKVQAQTSSITDQVKILTEELNKPTTSLQRQLELTSEIEQLEAKRAALNAEDRIAKELSGKKQQLTLEESLLNIEKAKISLFSRQDEFGGFSILLAKARVKEGERELKLAQDRLKIANQESLIKKEEAVKSLDSKADRTSELLKSFTGGGQALAQAIPDPNTKTGSSSADAVKAIDDTKQAALKEADQKSARLASFSDNEQATISRAILGVTTELGKSEKEIRENLFFDSGKLKVDDKIIKDTLAKGVAGERTGFNAVQDIFADGGSRFLKARDILVDKDIEAGKAKKKAESDAVSSKEQNEQANANKATTQASNQQAIAERKKTLQSQAKAERELVEKATKELDFTKLVNAVSETFNNLGLAVDQAIRVIESEFATRSALIDANNAVKEGTNAIANTFKSLSGLGSGVAKLGTELANLSFESGKFDEILLKRDKGLRENDAVLATTQKVFNDANAAVTAARLSNQNPDIIKALEKTRDDAGETLSDTKEQLAIRNQRIEEQTNLAVINANLQSFANKVQEGTEAFDNLKEKVSEQAELFKSVLDFNQRIKDNSSENNKTLSGFQSSTLNLFGKNNPIAKILDQRLQIQGIEDDTKQQKSQAVTEGKKEILDLTVQKAQLDLESKSFENQLTQTQLLADILSVSTGGTAQLSTTDEALKRIQQIPEAIQRNRGLNEARTGLIDNQLQAVPTLIEDRLRRIDLQGATRRIDSFSGNLNAYNADLLTGAFRDARGSGVRRSEIEEGSLQDSSFNQMLSTINNISQGQRVDQNLTQFMDMPQDRAMNQQLLNTSRELQQTTRQDSLQLQTSLSRVSPATTGGNKVPVFAPTLTFNFTTTGGGSNSGAENEVSKKEMQTYVSSTVNQSYKKLSTQLMDYAKSF